MIILSHRGYWKDDHEKNRRDAFRRSFDLGFGTETDVRDLKGELMIAHDMPSGNELRFSEMLDILGNRDLPLALNIKADGLAKALNELLRARRINNWFTFDMSIPELVFQIRLGIPVFTRASEYENPPPCYEQAAGVWLDSFHSNWYETKLIISFLRDGKKVCIVSPELHKRAHQPLWELLKSSDLTSHPSLMLCTDDPEGARNWFETHK